MLIVFTVILLFFTITASFLAISTSVSSVLHPDELNALKKIATTLGIKGLDLSSGDPCYLGLLKMIPEVAIVSNPELRNNTIDCDCRFNNNTTCRIINIDLKTLSLRGILPPELAELHYLQTIDLCRNYLSGSIPMEWASLPNLTYISLCANRLSGRLPSGLQNFKNLRFLGVEANQFSGPIPDELGNLTNLKGLQLGSNQFTGSLPNTLARLVNLEDFRVSDNNFNGTIPAFIGNWSRLQKLYLYASGLKGPIPDEIARLENLTNLFVTDTIGINVFPNISSQSIETLILRNVSLSGPIPSYIWNMRNLKLLDLSFNKLTGDVHGARAPEYTYLTGNRLSGEVESGVFLKSNAHISFSAPEVIHKSIKDAKEWQEAQLKEAPLPNDVARPPRRNHVLQSVGGLTCNVDAAWRQDTGSCGVGGVFHGPGSASLPLISYSRQFVNSALVAEGLAIRSAVLLAVSSNIQNLTILSDSQVIISLLKAKEFRPELYGIVSDIYHVCRLFETLSFVFVPRLENMEADHLAKSALSCMDSPPIRE